MSRNIGNKQTITLLINQFITCWREAILCSSLTACTSYRVPDATNSSRTHAEKMHMYCLTVNREKNAMFELCNVFELAT